MNKNKILINIPEVLNIGYYEYIYTGFYNLQRIGTIDEFNINTKSYKVRNLIINNINRLSTRILKKPLIKEKNWLVSIIYIVINDRKFKVAIDVNDTPWEFNDDIIEECDLYFKYQCPKNYEDGFYILNDSNKIEFSKAVIKNLHKVRPIIMPRPLSRKMDFELNNKILDEFRSIRENRDRDIDLLAYLGNCYDDLEIKNSHHPHIKRVQSMIYLNNMNTDKNIKIIFSPPKQGKFLDILPTGFEKLPTTSFKISDNKYRDICKNTKATLNIAGLRGSIPFRYIDAFLSGMLIVTDEPMVKWYKDLDENVGLFTVGKLGYELLSEIEFEDCMNRMESYIYDISKNYEKYIDKQNRFYEKYLTPDAVSKYMIEECIKILQ